jgi:hypothetical protein
MKQIVFNSESQEVVSASEVGLEFVAGVPQPVTDEQAEILLEKYDNEFLEGTTEEVAAMKNSQGRPYRGTPNPCFGKQKHPGFSLYVPPSDSSDESKPTSPSPVPAFTQKPAVGAEIVKPLEDQPDKPAA